MLSGLLAPLRLPERVLEALDELRPMRLELVRVRDQTEPLGDLLPALQRLEDHLGTRLDAVHDVVVALESEESHLNATIKEMGAKVGDLTEALAPVDDRLVTVERTVRGLSDELKAIHETINSLKEDIQRITGLSGERGVMERARDAITGNKDEKDEDGS